MAWSADVGAEIAEMFSCLDVPDARAHGMRSHVFVEERGARMERYRDELFRDPEGTRAKWRAAAAERLARDPDGVRAKWREANAARKARDPEAYRQARRESQRRWLAKRKGAA